MASFSRAVVCLVAALAVTTAAAQTGSLAVEVVDAAGLPLPGATVTISHKTGNVKTTAQLTGDDGRVDFPVLKPGVGYSIAINHPGYNPRRYDDLRVHINDPLVVSVQLMELLEERVTVKATRDVIDLTDSSSSYKFSADFVTELPVEGRFYQNILPLAPGVLDADGDGNPNVHGSRERDFAAMIGGVRNVDPLTGKWMSRINPNSIEEIEVITAGAGVEFGRAQGGFARIIQKQGNNDHEGTFEFFYRSSQYDQFPTGYQLGKPDYKWVQPALQLTGPILRDRLWYRFSHEYRDVEEPLFFPSRDATTTTQEWTHSDQITWQVSPRNKLAFLFQSDPHETTNLGVNEFRPAEASWGLKRNATSYAVTWTAPYSTRLLVESTAAWQDLTHEIRPTTQGIENDCIGLGPAYLRQSQCTDLTRGPVSGSYYRTQDDHSQRFSVNGKVTAYARLAGMSHQFRAGMSIENERYFRELGQTPFGFKWTPKWAFFPVPRYLVRPSFPQSDEVRATGTNVALYVEDQFKPARNVTITVGLRVDKEELTGEGPTQIYPGQELRAYEDVLEPWIPILLNNETPEGPVLFHNIAADAWPSIFTGFEDYPGFEREMQNILCEGRTGLDQAHCRIEVSQDILEQSANDLESLRSRESFVLDNTNLSPFLALAWSPGSNGKTALKVAFGRHYNNIPLIVPLQDQEPVVTEVNYTRSYYYPWWEPYWILNGDITPTVSIQAVDRALRTPYQDEFTAKIEREIWAETSLSATYINRKFRDQIQDVNTNLATGDYGHCGPSGIEGSPGTGDTFNDPMTGESYVDMEPGFGDGRIDNCDGDRYSDLYVQNPFWGDVFLVTNANSIDYTAFILELIRRQYRGWELQGSYTWSKAVGDGEDFFQELGNDPSLRLDVFGFQSYDQRHAFKLNAVTITPWGFRAGGSLSWHSGLPYSHLIESFSFDTLPPILDLTNVGKIRGRTRQIYPTAARNDSRNAAYWNLDLRIAKEFRVGRSAVFQLSAEVFNVMNEQTYMIYDFTQRSGQQVNLRNEAHVRPGRRIQLGLKVSY